MSLKNRAKALDIILEGIVKAYNRPIKREDVVMASHILNQLMKNGFLNKNIIVHAKEIKKEIALATLKCKVKE